MLGEASSKSEERADSGADEMMKVDGLSGITKTWRNLWGQALHLGIHLLSLIMIYIPGGPYGIAGIHKGFSREGTSHVLLSKSSCSCF